MLQLLAATLVGAVLTAPAPAAVAVPDPVHGPEWTSTECAKGTLTGAIREPRGGGVIVTGEAKECGTHVPGSFFAVATFHLRDPDAKPFAEFEDARYYREGESRSFGVRAFSGTGTEAVCLMLSATKRIACAWVRVPEVGPATVVPLPVNHPVVARPVELGWDDGANPDGSSKCGTCW